MEGIEFTNIFQKEDGWSSGRVDFMHPLIEATDNRSESVFLVLKRCGADREKTNKKKTRKQPGFNVNLYN
jgi:hypothetical protein